MRSKQRSKEVKNEKAFMSSSLIEVGKSISKHTGRCEDGHMQTCIYRYDHKETEQEGGRECVANKKKKHHPLALYRNT